MHRNDLDVRRAVCRLIQSDLQQRDELTHREPSVADEPTEKPRPENIVLRDSQDDGRPCFDERDVAARLPIPGPPGTLECFDGFRDPSSRVGAWPLPGGDFDLDGFSLQGQTVSSPRFEARRDSLADVGQGLILGAALRHTPGQLRALDGVPAVVIAVYKHSERHGVRYLITRTAHHDSYVVLP